MFHALYNWTLTREAAWQSAGKHTGRERLPCWIPHASLCFIQWYVEVSLLEVALSVCIHLNVTDEIIKYLLSCLTASSCEFRFSVDYLTTDRCFIGVDPPLCLKLSIRIQLFWSKSSILHNKKLIFSHALYVNLVYSIFLFGIFTLYFLNVW